MLGARHVTVLLFALFPEKVKFRRLFSLFSHNTKLAG